MHKDDQQVIEPSPPDLRPRPVPAGPAAVPLAERIAARVLNGPLTLALLGLCGVQLATWVPHYLTWPWFADHDVFATLAIGWEHGQLPYRDLIGNNFPARSTCSGSSGSCSAGAGPSRSGPSTSASS